MTAHRTLARDHQAFRIGDPAGEHPIWDDGGARQAEGRWHEVGSGVIYASEHYSTAMLEKLVHFNGEVPPNQHFIDITIPAGTSYEVVNPDALSGWASFGGDVARDFGKAWYTERRSAILFVPSVVARMERNIVFNTSHPDFKGVTVSLETPVWWDRRLFD
ncbi:RES domain-containing protein [Aestuariivita sp.]|jgi:RES domain-containing protein|uniref:RES family NAD+ phosphorylase n=1 Tax=Aestuariivita sp. TaxID=1872407 RepID=UPI00216CAC92|nr:RES domain-containing protein [Aestuariivita sp.]MCE8007089.1 RES domain-containing protein [Aestuariivita sp.]